MDTTLVVVIALFALLTVAAFAIYRQRGKVKIKAPGFGFELDGSNETPPPAPGVKVVGAKSRKGGLLAQDQTGRGADVQNVEVDDDILVSSTPPGQDPDPKA